MVDGKAVTNILFDQTEMSLISLIPKRQSFFFAVPAINSLRARPAGPREPLRD